MTKHWLNKQEIETHIKKKLGWVSKIPFKQIQDLEIFNTIFFYKYRVALYPGVFRALINE